MIRYFYRRGEILINKEMTILDIVEKYSCTQDIFHDLDEKTGVCLMCENLFCTLKEISFLYNLDEQKLIKNLEKAIEDKM